MSISSPGTGGSTPRKPLVFFAGRAGGRLLDNVKYLFLQAAQQDYGFDARFLTSFHEEFAQLRQAGLPVVLAQRCTEELLRSAKLLVVDDFPDKIGPLWSALRHLPLLQLWHGIPLKKIGFPEIESQVNMHPHKARTLRECYSGYKAVASTSPWMTETLFSKVFEAGDFPETGFPRNDVLLRPPTQRDMINVDRELYGRLVRHRKSGGKVAVYMPTFRDMGGDFICDAVLELTALSSLCQTHNILLLAKFHPYVLCKAFHDLPGFELCDSVSDIYPLLPLADTLITDYSSVYFDFLLCDKPLLFFPYDMERYVSTNRELFFPYDSMTPGLQAGNQDELFANLLSTLLHNADPCAQERRALCNTLFTHCDAQASHRLCEYIRDALL